MTARACRVHCRAVRLSILGRLRAHRGALALGVVCLLATNVLGQLIPKIVGRAIDAIVHGASAALLPKLCGTIAALAILQGLIRIPSRIAIFNIGRGIEYELRNELFAKLLALQPSFYRRQGTGDLMSRLTNDLGSVRALFGPGILYVVNTLFAYAIAVPLMVQIDPLLTLVAVAPYPALFLIAQRYARRIQQLSREVQEEIGALGAEVQEDLAGVGVVKAYALEERRAAAFARRCESYFDKSMALARARGVMTPLMGIFGGVGTLLALVAGGWAVIAGRISLGDLIAFSIYLATLAAPTVAIGWILAFWQRGLAAWERLVEILAEQPTIADASGAQDGDVLRGDIEIRDLSIEMDGRRVLDHLSLRVPEGTVLGLVGRVGSGKSTLLDALPRLVEIPPGAVFIGGQDITRVPLARLRRSIGYAPQEAFLFSTTIRENVRLGGARSAHPTGGGDDGALVSALAAAGLGADLAAFPDGVETRVGERGITLSGGQRQRTALARALAADPPNLLLDDSLSSVDAQTEREVLGHLRARMRGRTAIVVSHRLAALQAADRIAVLDDGRVVDQGTHAELMARGGVYAALYSRQALEDELQAL
ncbi:MAG: ABC transporter ATP-binding protein [Myxococcota bacterium]